MDDDKIVELPKPSLTREELHEAIKLAISSYESLPPGAMSMSASNYDLHAVLLLLEGFFRAV